MVLEKGIYLLWPSHNIFKIILHRIISVVYLTSFLPETWTTITHDDELRRPPLSVKRPVIREALAFWIRVLRIVLGCPFTGD